MTAHASHPIIQIIDRNEQNVVRLVGRLFRNGPRRRKRSDNQQGEQGKTADECFCHCVIKDAGLRDGWHLWGLRQHMECNPITDTARTARI